MKVWVIMGNDHPDCVFASEAAAERYVDEHKNDRDNKHKYGGYWIYWRAYEFDVKDDR